MACNCLKYKNWRFYDLLFLIYWNFRKNLRRLEWIVLQAPIVRVFILLGQVVAVAEEREQALRLFYNKFWFFLIKISHIKFLCKYLTV